MRIVTKSERETKRIGKEIARLIILKRIKKRILGLKGELGSGKTTFLKGFAEGLGIRERVLSPTFILMRKFKIPKKQAKFKFFYHFDFYRIKSKKEIFTLKFKEIIKDPQNIIAIEWADKIKNTLPKGMLSIQFKFIDPKTREIMLKIPKKNLFSTKKCLSFSKKF